LQLSIVIPSYNFSNPERVINSLLLLEPGEILVIDSSSESPRLPKHPLVKLIHLPKRVFPGEARNVGWKKAQGEYILFVDADVVFTNKTREFVNLHLKTKPQDLVFGVYNKAVEGDNSITRILVAIQRYRFTEEFSKSKYCYGQSSHVIVRRDLYKQVGFFNPYLRMHEDKEFCIRATSAGIDVNVYPEFEAQHIKVFSLKHLMQDHFQKTYLAVKAMRETPLIFGKVNNQLSLKYKFTWISAFIIPFLLSLLVLSDVLGLGFSFLIFIFSLPIPVFACHETFKQISFKDKIIGSFLWSFIGGAISFGAGGALLNIYAVKTQRSLNDIARLARFALRVILKNGQPISIIHFITSRCNLRCNHCFYKESLDAKDPGEKSLQQINKTTKEIGPVLWYALGGGEPFVRSDLAEVQKTIMNNCKPMMMTIPTNAWYTEETYLKTLQMLQQMDGRQLTIQVSIDGPLVIHDGIRGEGSWHRIEATWKKLKELQSLYHNLSLAIITVVSEKNYHVYPEFVDELVEKFYPNQLLINIYRHESVDGPPLPVELVEAYKKAIDRYEWLVDKKHLKKLSYWEGRLVRAKEVVQKESIYRTARHQEFITPCTAGTLTYTIWEDGKVAPCEVLHKPLGNTTGDSDLNNFQNIVNSDDAKTTRKWIKDTKCKCTYECAMTVNTLFSWPLMGKTIKKVLRG